MSHAVTPDEAPEDKDIGVLLGKDDPRLAAFEPLRVPLWILDVDVQRILWANAEGLRFWQAEDLNALRRRDLSDMSPSVQRNLQRTRSDCARTGRSVSEHWTLYPQDKPRSVETVLSPYPLTDGRIALLAHVVHHTREQSSDTLHSAQALLHMATMVTLHDEHWNLVYANPAARAARPDGHAALPDLLERREDLEEIERRLAADDECEIEAPVRIGGGAWHAIQVRKSRDAINGEKAILVNAVDVTARRAAEEGVRQLAYRDALTDLPNRAALVRYLQTRIATEGNAADFELLSVDLDRFKRINDSLGFAVGDEILVQTARRLEQIAGKHSFVSRLSGNEFVIVTDDSADGRADGTRLVERIRAAMAVPLLVGDHKLTVPPSIGLCRCPEHGRSASVLLRHADRAMSIAKRGKLGYCVFDAAMDREIRERLALENDLVRALQADELELRYQPRVASADNSVVSFEALVRWNHPERGLLAPLEFIGLAEETGLIGELGEQVMRKAMLRQSAWRQMGYRISVSINVSPLQFGSQRLSATVQENIALSACDPTMIELEITESALSEDSDSVSETLEGIRALGVRIAIDDFGTGYSNLARLGTYPLDALKIDRSFIADSSQSALLEAIVAMGHALGLELVAEGIERKDQAASMRRRGCHELQGYLYSRPLVVADATAYLVANGRKSDALH